MKNNQDFFYLLKHEEDSNEYNSEINKVHELINDGDNSFLNINRKEFIKKNFDYGAESFRDVYTNNLNNFFRCLDKNKFLNKVLLFGEVQSGKTNNMIFIISLLRDLGYKKFIILNGTKNDLNNQSYSRFVEYNPKIKFLDFSSSFFSDSNDTEFLYGIKQNVDKLDNKFEDYSGNFLKSMDLVILDDESDEASSQKGKTNKVINAHLQNILEQKNERKFNSILYVPVSATPYANILYEYDFLKPDYVIPLVSSMAYSGIDEFNKRDLYKIIPEHIISGFFKPDYDNKDLISYIKNLISEFVIQCIEDDKNYQFLINTDSNVKVLENSERLVRYAINSLKLSNNANISLLKQRNISEEIFYNKLESVAVSLRIANVKSEVNNCPEIIVGGILLSRGVTFDNLLYEIMINNPDHTFNSDTLLQRARWFGYRKGYIDKMKIFVSKRGKAFYNNIGFVESELREMYTNNNKYDDLQIDDIKNIFKKYSERWSE